MREAIFISFLIILLIPVNISTIHVYSSPPKTTNLNITNVLDSYLSEERPTEQHGSEDYLSTGYTERQRRGSCYVKWAATYYACDIICNRINEIVDIRNMIFHFDLGSVPPGSEVMSALLRLHSYSPRDDILVSVYGLSESFWESGVNWLSRNGTIPWRQQGGTHELKELERGTLGSFSKGGGYYVFNVTDYYARVLRGEIENYGILITPFVTGAREESEAVRVHHYENPDICRKAERDPNSFSFLLNLDRPKELYAVFYSKELALREKVPDYSPTLMLRFKGPSVLLRPSAAQLRIRPGGAASLDIQIDGTYRGPLGVTHELKGVEGIKVEITGDVKMGSTLKVRITLGKDVPAGSYELRFAPVIREYDNSYFSDIAEAKVTLNVEKAPEQYRDFSMYCYTEQVNVTRGGSASFRVNVVYRGSFWAKVALSSSAPQGLVLSFDPAEGVPDFASNVTVNASEDAPLGLHEVTLMGTGGNITRSIKVKVNVLERTVVPTPIPTTTRETPTMMETSRTTNITTTAEEGSPSILYIVIPILALALVVSAVLLRRRVTH
ncbi:MAG: DNRLRE domain-containing protein [Candidatus Korarchaeum sp.]